MKQTIVETAIVIACVVGIIAGGLYINSHIDCFNFFGLAKGCIQH